jgi:tRNA (guanine37-N1)-methyltransferase
MFENYFDSFLESGIIASAFRNERGDGIDFEFKSVAIPKYNKKGFKGVDDSPFGGGVGMIMRPDALKDALIKGVVEPGGYDTDNYRDQLHIVCPAPRGKTWSQEYAMDFAQNHLSVDSEKDIVFICGRYEGIDERFLENYVDEYISLGDYILTGGELAVMIILDSAMRFSNGVLGNKQSALEESFMNNKLEHALYTRPQEFEGKKVPLALREGHHRKISEFRLKSSNDITLKFRPDLLKDDTEQ